MATDWGDSTRSVHLARTPDPTTRAIAEPEIASSAFAFPDIESWQRAVGGSEPADVYSRNSNPTVRRLEERMAAFEGADAAVAFSTGMAAISCTLLALLGPGKRAVAGRDAYGATYLHFADILPRYGVECAVVDTAAPGALTGAIAAGCDLVYIETPTNPTLRVVDLEAVASASHDQGALLVVDNTLATPINQNPLASGADLVLHSATKYLCGHGDVLGGVACGDTATVAAIHRFRELTGPALDAHSAHLLLRSLLTLGLRVERQNHNAGTLAEFLDSHPAVDRVFYPGLPSHPGHDTASRQMRGYGGVLSFTLVGGMEAAMQVLPRLRLANLAANLGQVDTTVGPAFLTSHVELDEQERAASGVPDDLVRYAAGIEDPADLLDDLEAGLGALGA